MSGADFRARLANGPVLLLDGATGTELNRRGVDTSLPLWSSGALMCDPDAVLQVHLDYVAAGAECITTNTFRTHRRTLAAAGLGRRAAELTGAAVRLARQALGGRDGLFVAGSVAPLEDCYSPALVPEQEALVAEHTEMVEALAGAGVDVLLIETMNTVREAVAAANAAVATGLPTLAGLVCGRDGRLLSGESVQEAAAALQEAGVDGLLINCAPAPDVHKGLRALRESAPDLPRGAYGNVGYADDSQGWVNTDSVDPEAYAGYAESWLGLGARLIGSCCGTGPAHTAALRRLIDSAPRPVSDS